MKSLVPARQHVRSHHVRGHHVRAIASVLIASLLIQASPLPALAATATPPRDLAQVTAQVRADLARLQQGGKEAYVDDLFERLDADEGRAVAFVGDGVHRIGAKKLCMALAAIGSPVLAGVLAVIPQSWEEKLVVAALTRFVHKAVREVKAMVAKLSAPTLERGLRAILALLGNPGGAAQALTGDGASWWERFFSNSTAVRNFLVTIVALASIGVAVGLAIAGSTAAPVVAVVGALVALIALIVPGPGDGHLALAD